VGKPYLLLDRDGTLIVEKNYLSDPSDVEFYEGIPEALQKVQRAGWGILVLTNQSGIGRELMGLHDMQAVNNRIQELLCPLDVRIDAFYYCPHLPNAGCQCRKPNRGMVDQAIQDFGFDPIVRCRTGSSDWRQVGPCANRIWPSGRRTAYDERRPRD